MAIVLLAGILTACSAPQKNSLPVVRYLDFKVIDAVYVAVDNGLFEKHGIHVELAGSTLAGPTAIQAVSSGNAEAGLSSLPALINANAAGLPVMGVVDAQSALPGQALETYFVRSDSGIKSVKDLKGKNGQKVKFAVNLWKSSFQYTAFMELERNGMKDDAVEFVLLPFDQQAEALSQGKVDVIGLIEPYATFAKEKYGDKFTKLFDAIDTFGAKQFSTIFVNRLWAKDHPEQAKAFVAAIVEAQAWMESHQADARPIIAKYTKVDPKYVPDYHFQKDGKIIDADVEFWLKYMIDRKDVTVKWLKPEDIASNVYHP